MGNNNKIEIILKTVEEFEKAFLTGYSGNALQARKDMLKEYGKYLLERVSGLPINESSGLHLQSVTHSALLEASKAIVSNIETWLDTGDPADSKTSKMLYDNLKKAIVDVEHCG